MLLIFVGSSSDYRLEECQNQKSQKRLEVLHPDTGTDSINQFACNIAVVQYNIIFFLLQNDFVAFSH